MIGAPVSVNGTAASVGSDYPRYEATELPYLWGDLQFDLKDSAHNSTSSVSIVGPTMHVGGIELPRKHPHRTAPQLVSDFTHGAEMLEVGDRRVVDPSLALGSDASYHLNARQNSGFSRDACHVATNSNNFDRPRGYPSYIGAYSTDNAATVRCHTVVFDHNLPNVANSILVDGASLSFNRRAQPAAAAGIEAPDQISWVYFGTSGNMPPASTTTNTAVGAWDGLAGATAPPDTLTLDTAPAARTAIDNLAPPILDASAPPAAPTGNTLATHTFLADPEDARYYITAHLRSGDRVASVVGWDISGVNIDASQARIIAAAQSGDAPTLRINYSVPLQPIATLEIGTQLTPPTSLSIFDNPPFQRLTVTMNQSLPGAAAPTALDFRVREAGSNSTWLNVDGLPDEDDITLDAGGHAVLYADVTQDPWPDGGHNLAGRGPFEWQARAIYSIGDASNNVQGPWVNATSQSVALCGAVPGPVRDLTAARVDTNVPDLNFTWRPPRNAPLDQCGALTYGIRAIDEGQTIQYLRNQSYHSTSFVHTFPAFDRIRFYVLATNSYGSGGETEVSATAPAHGHAKLLTFVADPYTIGRNPNNTEIVLQEAGSASFAWTVNETAVDEDAGILRPSHYTIAYLRVSPVDGHQYWQTLVTAPDEDDPDARLGHHSVEFRYDRTHDGRFNSAGGFLPQVPYNVSINPYYTDGFHGPTLYAAYTGAADRILSSTIGLEINRTSGHPLQDVLRINASIYDVVNDEPGVTYDVPEADGIMWTARYTEVDSDLNRVDRTIGAWASAAFPNTTTTVDCAPDSKGDDPCEFLRAARNDISLRTVTAYLYTGSAPPLGRQDYTEYDIADLPEPCVPLVPRPSNFRDLFIYDPAEGAPETRDAIGDIRYTWDAHEPGTTGSADCTYGLGGYYLHVTAEKSGTTIAPVELHYIRGTEHTLEDVHSSAWYSAFLRIRTTHGGGGGAATEREVTPPWPVRNLTAADYPVAAPHTVELSWAVPPHQPPSPHIYYEIYHSGDSRISQDGPPPTYAYATPPLPPATWRCYSVTACADPDSGTFDTDACSAYAGGSPSVCAEPHYLPDAVTTLTGIGAVGAVTLQWDAPAANTVKGILDYQINWTSPYGEPLTPVPNKAAGNATSYIVHHLPLQTGSSLRVAAETVHTVKARTLNLTGATILNVHPSIDFTPGNIDLTNETRDAPVRKPHITIESDRDGQDVRPRA